MKKIYLIDGNNFIYRMFFALPEFSTKEGEIVNAVFGMAKFFALTLVSLNPDYIIFIKDSKGENFRHKLYSDYKATRDRMPDNLRTQVPIIEDMISKMKIPIIEEEGYEADDVIGTLSVDLGKDNNNSIEILSGDKDLYSLVGENIKIYDTMKGKRFGPKETRERFGVDSKMITDYLAIIGDKSDNIPGIDGFGPQKAVLLINNIGTVEQIYEIVASVEAGEKLYTDFSKELQSLFKGKTFEKLLDGKENAFLSKKLATIKKDLKIKGFRLEDYKFEKSNIINSDVIDFFEKYEFNSLLGENGVENYTTWQDEKIRVKIIENDSDLNKLNSLLNKYNEIIIDTETTSINCIEAELVGVSLYLDKDNIYYINRLHKGNGVSDNALKNFINNLLKSEKLIIGHNIKFDLEILDLYLKDERIAGIDCTVREKEINGEQTSFAF